MKKIFLIVPILCFQLALAQGKSAEKPFNFGPMFRIHGFLPINTGDNYLAESNSGQVSVGGNLSFFECYKFRLAFGLEHAFYKTKDLNLAADVNRTRNSSFYMIVTYRVPITEKLSVEPYLGGGWSEMHFKRPNSSFTNVDATIEKQRGTEFRTGFYVDYKIEKIVSFFMGINYVGSNFKVKTVPELQDYFGKAETIQISLGIKLGYTLKDKYNDRAAKQLNQ